MEVKAITRMARIAPTKVRDTARNIRGLAAAEAMDVLHFSPTKGARLMEKTLKSAMANAENNFGMNVDTLVVKEAMVNEGPAFKRFQPTARGGAWPIRKRTSHLVVILTQREEKAEAPKAKKVQKEKDSQPKKTQPKKTKASAKAKEGKSEEKK